MSAIQQKSLGIALSQEKIEWNVSSNEIFSLSLRLVGSNLTNFADSQSIKCDLSPTEEKNTKFTGMLTFRRDSNYLHAALLQKCVLLQKWLNIKTEHNIRCHTKVLFFHVLKRDIDKQSCSVVAS